MSPFAAIHETNIHHACFLAQAFISANSEEELFAILRFADEASGRGGGYFASYLHGKHFDDFTDRNGDFLIGAFEACKDAAYTLRDESNAEWSLYFNV